MDLIKDATFSVKWEEMKPTILKMLNQETITKGEWCDLFVHARSNYFWNEYAAILLHNKLKNIILNSILSIKEKINSHLDDDALLEAYVVQWKKFTEHSFQLSLPFVALNGYFNIKCLLLKTWKEHIVSKIIYRLQKAAIKIVNAERNGEVFDSQLVIGLRQSFLTLSMSYRFFYEHNFEKFYINEMENFYKNDAVKHLNEHGIANYIQYAIMKFNEEEVRAKKYLDLDLSYEIFYKSCSGVLFAKFKDSITAEYAKMIRENDKIQLQFIFRLNNRYHGNVKLMCDALEQCIFDDGLATMLDSASTITKDSVKYVEKLVTLFNRFSKLVKESFDNDKRFTDSRDTGFRRLVNDTSIFKLDITFNENSIESKFPELLASFCHSLLRKTAKSKKLTSDQIDKKLKDVILLLRYVKNIDKFLQYHKSQLAMRLILGTTSSIEKEEKIVIWMREEVKTFSYSVIEMIQMFRDIKVSEKLSEEFKNQNHSHYDFNIRFFHPTFSSLTNNIVSLPKEIKELFPKVEQFYTSKHRERKLQWNHKMSHGTISFSSSIGKFDIEVNSFQVAVLFLWNEPKKDRITFEDLKLETELSDLELKKTLLSLVACPRVNRQLVLCKPEVKTSHDFKSNTEFWINEEFCIVKGKLLTHGKVNIMPKLQFPTIIKKL